MRYNVIDFFIFLDNELSASILDLSGGWYVDFSADVFEAFDRSWFVFVRDHVS
jgi:hypothetical protein